MKKVYISIHLIAVICFEVVVDKIPSKHFHILFFIL